MGLNLDWVKSNGLKCSLRSLAYQNNRQNLSFVKDIHTYGEKMARNGRTKDIYKGTFICIQTLPSLGVCGQCQYTHLSDKETAYRMPITTLIGLMP